MIKKVLGITCLTVLFVWFGPVYMVQAANMTYPADFPAGTTLNDAIHNSGISTGETLTVTGYGSQNPFKGFNNDKGLIIVASGGPFLVAASADSDFTGSDSGNPLVLNHQGGTVDGFIFQGDYTNVTNWHHLAFAGDNGGTWRNCTFRITGTWWDGEPFSIYSGSPNLSASILVENCTFESTATTDVWTGDHALIHVNNGYHPVFNNCTIKGRGRNDRRAILLIGSSATFNSCNFDINRPANVEIFLEGNGQVCNLNDCEFHNPRHQAMSNSILWLGTGGEAGPATFNCRRTQFHTPICGNYAQPRLLVLQRVGGVVNFENCSIYWNAGQGQPDGWVLFENCESSSLSFKHCTVVDQYPIWNGRFIQAMNTMNCTIDFQNNIFDGHVSGEAGLGLVYGSGNSGLTFNNSGNLRYDITSKAGGFEETANLEGMDGFTFVNPQLGGDAFHLSSNSTEAYNKATSIGITDDIDGDARPIGSAPDIGCDEAASWPPPTYYPDPAPEPITKYYPADFPAGTTLQGAIHYGTVIAGDTLIVTGYGPDNPFKGFNNDVGLKIVTSGGPFTVKATTDDDFTAPSSGTPLVLNHKGGTLDGFIIEGDYTNVANQHHLAFGGDGGGHWKNCTFRFTGRWYDGDTFDVYGPSPTVSVTVENCTFEQTATVNDFPTDLTFIRVLHGYQPVFTNCTIKGRGREDHKCVLLIGGSATFNNCTFDNDSPSQVTVFIEGAGQVCNLNDCLFQNPTHQTLRDSILWFGSGGTGGACTFNCRRTLFHAPIGSAYPQTRLMVYQRSFGTANFENCSIFWNSIEGQPDGVVLFENHEEGLLSFKHCTVVDQNPQWNGRFIQIQNTMNSTIEFTNSIFDGRVPGDLGLGLVYSGGGNSGVTYTCSNNIRYDITGPAPDYIDNANQEGMEGFTYVDPMLAEDDIHLTAESVAAIDKAPDVGVTDDIDGQSRPQGSASDIGADEVSVTRIENWQQY